MVGRKKARTKKGGASCHLLYVNISLFTPLKVTKNKSLNTKNLEKYKLKKKKLKKTIDKRIIIPSFNVTKSNDRIAELAILRRSLEHNNNGVRNFDKTKK